MSCHTNTLNNDLALNQAKKMHAHYLKLLGSEKQLTCAACHVEVGHKGLNNMLNYWDPQYSIYEKKAKEKKEQIKKEYFKDSYKTTENNLKYENNSSK